MITRTRLAWIGALGEEAFNDRKRVAGGFWSNMAHYQAVVLAARAVTLKDFTLTPVK
jgi:hypothetical protein